MEVVPLDLDPSAEHTRRRRTLLRIALPLGGVGLIVGFLLGIAVYADSANRAGVLGLSETLLTSLRDRIASQVSSYLEPASHAILLAQSIVGRGGATDRSEEARVLATSVLHETPQIANVLFADAAGNFMLVRRAPETTRGGTEIKHIGVMAGHRVVEWTTRDRAGAVVAHREDPEDAYDARTRGWFTGARESDDVFWTEPYIFFSERAPGITAAVRGPDPEPDIVGVDIRLDALSRFLGGLAIGRTGRAYIVAETGEMIAGPDPAKIMRQRDGKPVPAHIDDVGDTDLIAGWDHFRVSGQGTRIIESNGRRLISIVVPLTGAANDAKGWLLLITVPEAEFSGFVTANSQNAALLSLVVVALAIGLGVLLVRQGLRADRADRAVAERSEAVRLQSAAFARMTTEAEMFDAAGSPPEALTETLAEATGARRAGFWRMVEGGRVLRCEDSYEPATSGHVGGLELARQEVPALMEALSAGMEIDVPDARADRRTAPLHAMLMKHLGSTALFVVPVMHAGLNPGERIAVGAVFLEDARRDPAARDIARACATLIALRTPMSATLAAEPDARPRPQPVAAVVTAEQEREFDPALTVYRLTNAGFAARSYPMVAVLVLRLPETAIALAAPNPGQGPPETLAHTIAAAAQDAAATHGIGYVKMLGSQIVAAAGIEDGAATAAARLADMAVALRERCEALLEDVEDPAAFAMGLDVGLALGGMVGADPGIFNLWGEAVRGAEALAASAPEGAIQASDSAYGLLRQDFLFRPRGRFFRPDIGESPLYVLAGRV